MKQASPLLALSPVPLQSSHCILLMVLGNSCLNKPHAGNGSYAACHVFKVTRSPSPDEERSFNPLIA
jgi:hypothetical protein